MTKDSDSPESSSSATNLRAAIVLTSALISISHSIRVFTLKWQLIRTKLDYLASSLSAANRYPDREPSITDLLVSVLASLFDCDELARRCLEVSYNGKLLMQSDLDLMATKLDLYGTRLINVVKGASFGTIVDSIVVSRPRVGACRDDLRFYVIDLMRRLKVGGKEMRLNALVALREAVVEEERFVKVLVDVDEDDGVLSVLVNCLDLNEIDVCEECVDVLSFLLGFWICRCRLVEAGVIAPLIRVLERGSEKGMLACLRCLMKLTVNSDNAWCISAHGGVLVLICVCKKSGCVNELIGLSCRVLMNLVDVVEIKGFMIEHGVISMLIRLVRSRGDEASQIGAIELLQSLADGDEIVRLMIVNEGGIRALIRVSEPKLSSSLKCREAAIRAIDKLCFSSDSGTSLTINYGYMDQLLYFLYNGEVSIQEMALKSVYKLSKMRDDVKKVMGDTGFIPAIVKYLNAKSFEVQEMAAESLHKLLAIPKNLKRFAQDIHNISLVLQLLDPQDINSNPGTRKFLLSILTDVTNCSSGRRKILTSGYVVNIEKLAQAEVTDAKRIVKKLSTNRFKNILNGFWHS